eukprot:3849781-Pleurochrysis_carterae.AAC.1
MLVLTELACRFALEVDLVDRGNNLGDGALINSHVGEAQRSPGVVVVNFSQAGARRLAVGLDNLSCSFAVAPHR